MPFEYDSQTTLLVISSFGVPPYSARGLTQTYEPIDASKQLHRTINGVLHDFSHEQFRKLKSTITCRDMDAPALDGVWPGRQVTVDCVAALCYQEGGSPSRPVYKTVKTESGFVYYLPRLTMMVTSWSQDEDEYGAAVGWTLELEEV